MADQPPPLDVPVVADVLATRQPDGVSDVEQHLRENGPWRDKLSQVDDAPDVTSTVERSASQERAKVAA